MIVKPHINPVFVANWKMHHGPSATRAYVISFLRQYAKRGDRQVILCPPFVSLDTAATSVRERPDVQVAAQNIFWEERGAYTGEISAFMVRDTGANFVLLGHSERRHMFGETEEQIRHKVKAALGAGLRPIICIGETLAERKAGQTLEVVVRQLRAATSGLTNEIIGDFMVAYEPVWAIGTGKTATPEDAADVHRSLRESLIEAAGHRGAAVPILYGGSVKAENSRALLDADEVNGLLVGGASLEPSAFGAICRS